MGWGGGGWYRSKSRARVRTHTHTARVAMEMLKCSVEAHAKKPRGAVELEKVLAKRIRASSKMTADGGKATEKAAGYLQIPLKTCNHQKEFRDSDGTHTNNAESEAARFKKWARPKWTQVHSVSVKNPKAKQKHLLGKIN